MSSRLSVRTIGIVALLSLVIGFDGHRVAANVGTTTPGGAAPVVLSQNPALAGKSSSADPAGFDLSKIDDLSDLYKTCSDVSTNLLSSFGQNATLPMGAAMMGSGGGPQAMKAMGATFACDMLGRLTMDSPCPGFDGVPQAPDQQQVCNMIHFGGRASFDMYKTNLEMAMCSQSCKKGKAQAIQAGFQCMQTQSELLNIKVKALTDQYQNRIQTWQTDVKNMDIAIDDRKIKLEDMKTRLTGGPRSLTALKAELLGLVNTIPKDIQEAQKKVQDYETAEIRLKEKIQNRKMALTGQCFTTTPVARFRCDANGGPVSARAFLECRFKQTLYIGKNNVIEQGQTVGKQAESKTAALTSVLDQIFANAPNQAQLPQTNEDLTKSTQQAVGVLNVADVDKKYGGQLAQFKIGNTDARSFMLSEMKRCEGRSETDVNREANMKNTAIGQEKNFIRDLKQDASRITLEHMNRYNQTYMNVLSGVTGSQASLNLNACRNAIPSFQVNCLKDMQPKMQALLESGKGSPTMKFTIKGNGSKHDPSDDIACKGINECISTLEKKTQQTVSDQKTLITNKDKYVLSAKQKTERFNQEVAKKLGGPSQAMAAFMRKANAGLASLGKPGLGTAAGKLQPETLRFDPKTGLPEVPTNPINVVGPLANPPLSNPDQFITQGPQSTGQIITQSDQLLMQLKNQHMMAQQMPIICEAMRNQMILERASQQMMAAQHCRDDLNCRPNKHAELDAQVLRIGNSPGAANSPALASLQNGMLNACQPQHNMMQGQVPDPGLVPRLNGELTVAQNQVATLQAQINGLPAAQLPAIQNQMTAAQANVTRLTGEIAVANHAQNQYNQQGGGGMRYMQPQMNCHAINSSINSLSLIRTGGGNNGMGNAQGVY